jgi:outer membrane murein-binding lipoprotein Lpp
MNRRISEKDLKLLIFFFALLILIASYQLGYRKFTTKAEELSTENQELTKKVDELEGKQGSKEEYISQTEEMNKKMDTILEQYPAKLTQEKITMFVLALEKYADMKVSSISFQEITEFFSMTDLATKREENALSSINDIESTIASDTSQDTDVNQVAASDEAKKENSAKGNAKDLNITGYQTAITLNYQTNYEGLKKCVDYINRNEDKMTIHDLSASFDSSTGNLTGSMTINLYSITGTDKVYEEPEINGGRIGTKNIFGTFELPVTNE